MEWIFMAVALVMVARSPVGIALAERIRSGPHGGAAGARFDEFAAQVGDDFRALRDEVAELSERMDFTERTLTAMRRSDALPDGPGRT
ncbi:MAG: hypothetical protein HY337_11310 [Gemmatimonadetes bacterium]|nr:hypothetical protein [Gemmatimonadota bacterium]